MLENIIYLGTRESDCLWCGYKKSYTFFGSGKHGNVALNKLLNCRYNHNNLIKNNDIFTNYFVNCIKKEVSNNPNAKFCYYNKFGYNYLPDELKKYIVFQSKTDLLIFLNDKHSAHKWASKMVGTLDYFYAKGEKINYNYCSKVFKSEGRFVIQARESLGGIGTYLLTKTNENKVLNLLSPNEEYSISQYKENNISVNVHFLISDKDILLLPPSLQIIDTSNEMLEYFGCDYAAYYDVVGNMHSKVKRDAMILLENLKKQGYRGVGGIDFLIADNKVYFMEINARYQSSTSVLNYVLHKAKLPTVNELDAMCYLGDGSLPHIPNIIVPYSKCAITSTISDRFPNVPSIKLRDGYTKCEKLDDEVYLYTLLYKGSILLNNGKGDVRNENK